MLTGFDYIFSNIQQITKSPTNNAAFCLLRFLAAFFLFKNSVSGVCTFSVAPEQRSSTDVNDNKVEKQGLHKVQNKEAFQIEIVPLGRYTFHAAH